MKKLIFLSFFLTILSLESNAQCNSEQFANACVPKLAENGFNFLKTYKINGEKDLTKVEYSYVFTKGTQYMVAIADQSQGDNAIMVTIYDSERRKVASNKVKGNLLSGMIYPCNATGIYYLQYTFEGPSERCGGSALGFKK